MKENEVIRVEDLDFTIETSKILSQVSLSVSKNEFVGLIGPNGSGKSTILKNIYRQYSPSSGAVYLNGKDIYRMKSKEVAQQMAVVAQENQPDFDFSVREMVMMGRYSRKKMFEQDDERDLEVTEKALSMVGMQGTEERSFLSLSGGEKQRIYLAMAFAQESSLIILDEPTNHLDIGSQIKTLSLLKNSGKTVLTALHDLSLAARFCDRVYVLKDGRNLCDGQPETLISSELVKELYQIEAEVFTRKDRIYIDYK